METHIVNIAPINGTYTFTVITEASDGTKTIVKGRLTPEQVGTIVSSIKGEQNG